MPVNLQCRLTEPWGGCWGIMNPPQLCDELDEQDSLWSFLPVSGKRCILVITLQHSPASLDFRALQRSSYLPDDHENGSRHAPSCAGSNPGFLTPYSSSSRRRSFLDSSTFWSLVQSGLTGPSHVCSSLYLIMFPHPDGFSSPQNSGLSFGFALRGQKRGSSCLELKPLDV